MEVAQRRSSASSSSSPSSPEFEFWPLSARPAASPSSADELFAGGVLLPKPPREPAPAPDPDPPPAAAAPGAAITAPAPPPPSGGSKRWTDIFKNGDKKAAATTTTAAADEKEKRKCKPAAGGGSELNINIWPFSRSRSAGGGGGRPRPAAGPRKSSSAPCSRSNSRGEAGAPPRRWAASPGRAAAGVPVGRASPVWQIRRPARPGPAHAQGEPALVAATDRRAPKDRATGGKRSGGGVRGINLSVNSCIGYRHQVSCRRVDTGGVRTAGGEGGGGLFGIKAFFSKKVH